MSHYRVHRARWYRTAIVASLGLLAPAIRPAESQAPAQTTGRAVHGTVFDSIAGRPLYGAAVQVVAVRSTQAPWTTTTDSAGRYRVDGLPAGQYTVGFYHDALTTLGLDAVTRTIELAADTLATVDLAIPSSAMVRALRCGQSDQFAQGMLVGFVRDAATRAAIAGTKARVHWRAFALDSANYRVVVERSTATVEADGAMLVCNLPVDVPLDLLVTAPGHREVAGSVVTVPAMGIGRLDVLLADSALTTGSAVIRGKVTRESGRAVGSGRVVIKSLGRDVAVTVVGKPSRDLRVLDDVLRRKRVGMGTVFLPGHPALRSATFTSDVMKEARGFRWVDMDSVTARARCRQIAVYVNDVRQPDMMKGLDHMAPVSEVLAIETWPDIMFAPVQYRHAVPTQLQPPRGRNSGGMAPPPPEPPACALVLVWTRQH